MLPHHSRPTKIMEAVDIMEDRIFIPDEKDMVLNFKDIVEAVVVDRVPVI